MNNDIVQLSIRNLLTGNDIYTIPMYQRNYAWDEGEITQLIQDVIDYCPENSNYYIGTLVVFERTDIEGNIFETIDGQQRLTTLSLLASFLKKECDCDVLWYKNLAIDFDSRANSRKTINVIFDGGFSDDPAELLGPAQINTSILNGYRLIKKILPQKLAERKISTLQFSDFLFDNVQIMRVKVPKDTDLNHYFEIMNNRGEQLEKHEVLKSRMMEVLKDDKEGQICLHVVWEACANMEKYVQMGFSPKQRDKIFGSDDWSSWKVKNFEDLQNITANHTDGLLDTGSEQTLDQLIDETRENFKTIDTDDTPERFNTVINFPNFLLHVLRIQTEQDVPLDDKKLISTFDSYLLEDNDAVEKVKIFVFDLLRSKFLYDQYIIKREFIKGTDGWSLKRLSRDSQKNAYYKNTFGDDASNEPINRRILLLLSAFHVSTPTLVYKHWLNAALHYLFTSDTINADSYLKYLESLASAFVFDRFLASNGALDYYEIIFVNKGICQTTRNSISEAQMEARLSFGNIENNLVFNFLDYLLWIKHQSNDSIIKDYEFTFRSSVEHYYPQNPLPGHDSLHKDVLNSFGNLCLISHSKNSRLSNFMPEAKKEHYRNNSIDSVKQYLMMNDKKWPQWNESSIKMHFGEMKSVFLSIFDHA